MATLLLDLMGLSAVRPDPQSFNTATQMHSFQRQSMAACLHQWFYMVVKSNVLNLYICCFTHIFYQTGAVQKVVSAFSRQVLWTRAAALLHEMGGLVFLQHGEVGNTPK